MAYQGMAKEGQRNIVNLLRCAWAGSQKYGTLVWSGDIDSSFRFLRNQLAAGLNMGLSGIPLWTTDIGGFHGGNINSESFKECLIRWFQFATFCPVMRLHGLREPFKESLSDSGGGKMFSGAENEVWSFGKETYQILRKYLNLREKLRPYIKGLMKKAHQQGTPLMRPLFYDFPEDDLAWEVEDQYMFGSDLLVCPILFEDSREREVYIPAGKWININEKKVYEGKNKYICKASLEFIPVFVKEDSDILELIF